MKIEIEKYRGFDIEFDTDTELFDALSDFYDKQEYKKSFSAIKKWIDDFVKENQTFQPFYIEKPFWDNYQNKVLKVVGIRKDGAFVAEDSEGKKQQISKYNEADYIEVVDTNKELANQYREIGQQIDALQVKRKEVKDKATNLRWLKDIKKEILQTA